MGAGYFEATGCWGGAGGVAASLVRLEDEWLDCESSDVPTDHPPSVQGRVGTDEVEKWGFWEGVESG